MCVFVFFYFYSSFKILYNRYNDTYFLFVEKQAGSGCCGQDAGVRPVKADQASRGLQPRVR